MNEDDDDDGAVLYIDTPDSVRAVRHIRVTVPEYIIAQMIERLQEDKQFGFVFETLSAVGVGDLRLEIGLHGAFDDNDDDDVC